MKWTVVSYVRTNSISLIDSSIATNVAYQCAMIAQSILLGYLTTDTMGGCGLVETALSRFTFKK
jgi:hypothetical protein